MRPRAGRSMKGFIDRRGFYTPEDVFVFGHRSIMAEIFKGQAQDPPAPSELCASNCLAAMRPSSRRRDRREARTPPGTSPQLSSSPTWRIPGTTSVACRGQPGRPECRRQTPATRLRPSWSSFPECHPPQLRRRPKLGRPATAAVSTVAVIPEVPP